MLESIEMKAALDAYQATLSDEPTPHYVEPSKLSQLGEYVGGWIAIVLFTTMIATSAYQAIACVLNTTLDANLPTLTDYNPNTWDF